MVEHPAATWKGKRSRGTGDPPKPMRVSVRERDTFKHMSVPERTEVKFPHHPLLRKLANNTLFLFLLVFFLQVKRKDQLKSPLPNEGKRKF